MIYNGLFGFLTKKQKNKANNLVNKEPALPSCILIKFNMKIFPFVRPAPPDCFPRGGDGQGVWC